MRFTGPSILPGRAGAEVEALNGPARPRLDSVDCLRGIVMVVMALDHTRDFLGADGSIRDVHDPALFLTRWITNFCAPTFVLLAGVGAFLYGQRSGDKARLSKFLLTRGLWLVGVELTVVHFGLSFSFGFDLLLLQVIWAIGWSMVLLAGLVSLPGRLVGFIGLLVIVSHNLLDGVKADSFGPYKFLWIILHQRGLFQIQPNLRVLAVYPLIPWMGVMLFGYGLGGIWQLNPVSRQRRLWLYGGTGAMVFLVVRFINRYGDPAPWTPQTELWASILSFVNCEKYPPSLLFLAMTLGSALLVLAALDQVKGPMARFFITFGRVPFFYYVAHLYLIHLLTVLVVLIQNGQVGWLFKGLPPMDKPAGWGFGLPATYALWVAVVLALYLPCRWFARIKQIRKDWWLSYL